MAAVVGTSFLFHVLALIVAERAYAPYSVSRTGEYVQGSTTQSVDSRQLAAVASSPLRLPSRR